MTSKLTHLIDADHLAALARAHAAEHARTYAHGCPLVLGKRGAAGHHNVAAEAIDGHRRGSVCVDLTRE
jgi:hypothetical protein